MTIVTLSIKIIGFVSLLALLSCGFQDESDIFVLDAVSQPLTPRLALQRVANQEHRLYAAWMQNRLASDTVPDLCVATLAQCRDQADLWQPMEQARLKNGSTAFRSARTLTFEPGKTTIVVVRWPGQLDNQWVYRHVRIEPQQTQEDKPDPQSDCHKADEFICQVELAVVRLTNELRERRGRGALQHHKGISYASRLFSDEQARVGRISHRGFPNDRHADYRREFGRLDIRMTRENVAMFHNGRVSSTEQVAAHFVRQWAGSPGHLRNMLASDIKWHGIGVTRRGSAFYATQIFGSDLVGRP